MGRMGIGIWTCSTTDSTGRTIASRVSSVPSVQVKAPKKTARSIKSKRAASLGRSPLTGAHVLKPVVKGASISLVNVRRVVRALEPLTLD